MDDFRDMANSPQHRRGFERMLLLAAERGDADLVEERLGWGVDPNCAFKRGRTPLIANVRGACPSAATVRALLRHGADASLTDEAGLSALDYARRKLLQVEGRKAPRPSPSLDENGQLALGAEEQAEKWIGCVRNSALRGASLFASIGGSACGRRGGRFTIREKSRPSLRCWKGWGARGFKCLA